MGKNRRYGTDVSRAAISRRGRFLVVLTLIVMALITVLVLGGSYALQAYERSHVIAVACAVTAAEGDVGSSTSGKGIGSSFDQVEVSTKWSSSGAASSAEPGRLASGTPPATVRAREAWFVPHVARTGESRACGERNPGGTLPG